MKKGNALHGTIVVLALCAALFVPLRGVLACAIDQRMTIGECGDGDCRESSGLLAGTHLASALDHCLQSCTVASVFQAAVKGHKAPLVKMSGFSPEPLVTVPLPATIPESYFGLPARVFAVPFDSFAGASAYLRTHRLRL